MRNAKYQIQDEDKNIIDAYIELQGCDCDMDDMCNHTDDDSTEVFYANHKKFGLLVGYSWESIKKQITCKSK